MSHVTITSDVQAPVDAVFGYVDDYRNFTRFMKDITRWEPTTSQTHGKGAKFAVAMKAGPATLDSEVDIIDWGKDRVIAWRSTKGMKQTGRWQFKPAGAGCEVTLDMEYEFPGGIAGRVLARAAEPVVRHNLEQSVRRLTELAEQLAEKAPRAKAAPRAAASKPNGSARSGGTAAKAGSPAAKPKAAAPKKPTTR